MGLSGGLASNGGGSSSGAKPYGLALGKGGCVIPISSRNHFMTDGTSVASGTSVSATYRQFWPLSDPLACTVLPVFSNMVYGGAITSNLGDVDAPNAITIAAAVEAADGTILPFLFNGKHAVTIGATGGQVAIPDAPVHFGPQSSISAGNSPYFGAATGVFIRVWVASGAWRADVAAVNSGSKTVFDTAVVAGDNGKPVTGPGIPSATYVGTVTAGTSFLLSSSAGSQVDVNATANGAFVMIGGTDTISRTDTVTVTNGSPTVADTSITAADLGRAVAGTGIPNAAVITSVIPGTSFTIGFSTDAGFSNTNATNSGVSVTISSSYPINYGQALTNLDQSNAPNGADVTNNGSGAFSGSNAAHYGPAVLLGRAPSARKPIVLQVSDSIFNGTSDNFIGPMQRACLALGYPFLKASKFGEYAQVVQSPSGRRYRSTFIEGATHAIVELGTNDGIDTPTKVTNLQGYLTTIGTWLAAMGIKPYLCTVMPRATSTDGFVTTANQTATYPAVDCASMNTWVRGIPSPYVGYFDLSDLVSSTRDSGLFTVGPTSRGVTDMVTTSGSKIITSATASFTQADVLTGIYVAGTNYAAGSFLIASVQSATQATTNVNANASVSSAVGGIGAWYGTWDGTHPGQPLMVGSIASGIQALIAGWSL